VSSDDDVVLVAGARTPFAAFGGALRDFAIPELGSVAVREAIRRANLEPSSIDELAVGVNLPGSDRSIARQVSLRAGIPDEKVAYTVDRACCSSLTAITMVARSVRAHEARIGVAAGAENMSRVPYFLDDFRWGHRLGDVTLRDQLVISCPHTGVPRAVQAANEALEFSVGREEQDRWAVQSQTRCAAAVSAGRFVDEIVPVDVGAGGGAPAHLSADESPRPATTYDALASLPTVYGSRTVTAGNAPGLSTGASAVVLTTRAIARSNRSAPIARVIATAMVSGPPERITSIPAVAAARVLDKAGVHLSQVKRIEINEAFAAVPLVSTLMLADRDRIRAKRLRELVNVNGGAIALGHPTGATGARLVITLVNELRRQGGGIGLATICGGIGEGEAILLEVEG
jgi:acetyl-CoA C-acetyltransferase